MLMEDLFIMNKILNLCIVAVIAICMFLVDIFMSIEKWIFMSMSILAIIISVAGLIYFNKRLFK